MKVTKLRLLALLVFSSLFIGSLRADDDPPPGEPEYVPPPPGPYYYWVPGIGWVGPDNPGGGDQSDSDR